MTIEATKFTSVPSAATADGAAVISAKKGSLLKLSLSVGATARWMKFYDKGAAVPLAASDIPFMRVWCSVGTTTIDLSDIGGIPFKNGLGIRMCLVGADTDATYTSFAVTDSFANVWYQEDR